MRTLVALAIAGALGTLARYGLEGWVSERTGAGFPWGTFVVNITGAFLLGLVFTAMTERLTLAAWVRSVVTIGFFGAYTTFSTLSFETFRLAEDGQVFLALANSLGSLAAGLVAVYGGVLLGRAV
jgi:CrcB protein